MATYNLVLKDGKKALKSINIDTGDKNLQIDITSALYVWEIEHNLEKKPAVQIFDDSGTEIEAKIVQNTTNKVTITFNNATTGSVIFN